MFKKKRRKKRKKREQHRVLSTSTCGQNLVRSVVQREDLHIEKENTGKENRMLNRVIWAEYGLETSVIVGMSSDQFYEWKPTLKHRRLCRVKNMLAMYLKYHNPPQGRTHSYYPCHFNRYFPCQNVDRTQIAY